LGRFLVPVLSVVVVAVLFAGTGAVARGVATAPGAPSGTALVTDAVPVGPGETAAPMAENASLDLEFALAVTDPAGLAGFLAAVENPSSPLYEHFLTHAEYEARYGPSATAVATLTGTLGAAGARDVRVAADRLSVTAVMSVASVESLLGVRVVAVVGPGGSAGYTSLGRATLPASLAGVVTAVDGLSDAADSRLTWNAVPIAPVATVPRTEAPDQFALGQNATQEQWFVGSDFTNTLGASALLPGPSSIGNATYPTGVAIATLLASGYNQSLGLNTPPWDPLVIETYFNDTLAPAWASEAQNASLVGVPVTIAGVTPPSPGPFGNVNDSTLDSWENALDLEMAGSLAPGASLYNFYFAGSLLASASSDSSVAEYFDQDLAAALAYDYGSARLGVVSASFGIGDLNDTTWNNELAEASAMGVTVVAASGDQGNAPNSLTGRDSGPDPLWPASAAFNTSGALAVGGVTPVLGGEPEGWFNGTDLEIGYDANVTGFESLSAWWDTSGGAGAYAGSEGGIATTYAEPYWQFHSAAQPAIANATIRQGASALGRAEPDVALAANSTIAFVLADTEGNVYFTVLEGTSIAAPSFAGLLADEIAVAHHDFGFVDPELYRIGSYFAAHPGPNDAFLDVTNGSNYVFAALPGWDAVTGWGVPYGPLLYAADATPAVRDYVYTGPTPGIPPPPPGPAIPWAELFIVFGVGIAVAIVLVVLMTRTNRSEGTPPLGVFGGAVPPGYPGAPGFPEAPSGGALPPPAPSYSMDRVPLPPGQGATMLCPYCGAPRPAGPSRCPRCGAL
jgi:subtilase family serine protease